MSARARSSAPCSSASLRSRARASAARARPPTLASARRCCTSATRSSCLRRATVSGLTGGCGGCCGALEDVREAEPELSRTTPLPAALAPARRSGRAELGQHLIAGRAERLPELFVVGAAGTAGRLPLLHLARQLGLGRGRVERFDERLGLLDQRAFGGACPATLAIALGRHRAAPVEGCTAARRETLPERLLLIAARVPGSLPLRHQSLERVPDRASVVEAGEGLGLGDQRFLALDRRAALARTFGVGAIALFVEGLACRRESAPQLAVTHLAGRGGRLPALEQIAEPLRGLRVARRGGQTLGLLGDRGAQHLCQRALVLSREHDLLGHLSRRRLIGGGLVLGAARRGRSAAASRHALRLAARVALSALQAARRGRLAASEARRRRAALSAGPFLGLGRSSAQVALRPREPLRHRSSSASAGLGSGALRLGLGLGAGSSSASGAPRPRGSSATEAPRRRRWPRRGLGHRLVRGLGLLGHGHLDGVRLFGGDGLLAHRLFGLGVSAIQTGLDHGCVRRLLGGRLHTHRRTLDDRSEPLIRAGASIGLDVVGDRGARAMHAESSATTSWQGTLARGSGRTTLASGAAGPLE